MGKGITVEDLERTMGQKASKVSDYKFNPELMCFERTITFKLDRKKPKARKPRRAK